MKTLYLIRHAKSDWAALGTNDFDRPLNERGKRNASEMASRLKAKGYKLNGIVSSPAKRAKDTAKAFFREFEVSKERISYNDELYLPLPQTIEKSISHINDDWNHVAIITHNDGITQYVNTLTSVQVDNMPTCSIYAVQVDVKCWKEYKNAAKQFLFFDYPKNLA